MRVVSTVHKAGWDVYGHKFLEGVENWPEGTEFIVYTEGFDLVHPKIKARRIESVERAEAFKKQYSYYRPIAWRWDIVRFGNKVFAANDALKDYQGIAVWLDADCYTYKQLPEGYVENLLPSEAYLACFKRTGWQTETGFWVMNCANPHHKNFLETWVRILETGQFKQLQQWCDASTLDATVRMFEKRDLIQTVSLSTPHEREEHPMALVDLAKYIDHMKGGRKSEGFSPENKWRAAA